MAHATPGEFRQSQNWTGSPGAVLNAATYVPPPVPEMQECLGQLEKFLHADTQAASTDRSGTRSLPV